MRKLFCFMTLFFSMLLTAQPPARFYTRFGGYGHDIGYSVVQTLNGQYAVAGSTSSFGSGNTDVYLALIDSMGWVRWEKSYGGFNNDIGKSIIQLQDSGFVIAGYTNSIGNGGYDVFVVRTDKNGNLIWQKAYGGLDWDFGYAVKATPAGDSLVVCGSTYSFGYGKSDGYVLKLDLNGNLKWQNTYGGAEDDEFKSFVLTYNNLYAFAGTTKSKGDIKGDCWIVKTDISGDTVKTYKYGNNYIQFLNDIKEHPGSKNFYTCGGYDQFGYDSTSAIILCVDENLNFQFNFIHTYHERNDEQYLSNAYYKNTMYMYLRRSNYTSTDLRLQTLVQLYDNNNYMDGTKYGSLEPDELLSISSTKNEGFVAVGYTYGYGANQSDVFLLKLDNGPILGAPSMVGINEPVQKYSPHISVYPTLTEDYFFIDNPSSEELAITISDCFGKILSGYRSSQSQFSSNLSVYPGGMYLITVSASSFTKTFRVIRK